MVKEKKTLNLQEFLKTEKLDTVIKAFTYEEGTALLESLLESVESGNLSLEDSVNSYEKGMQLLKHLQGLLDGAEKKLKVISLNKTGKSQE